MMDERILSSKMTLNMFLISQSVICGVILNGLQQRMCRYAVDRRNKKMSLRNRRNLCFQSNGHIFQNEFL